MSSDIQSSALMEKITSLCKRRGFIFQSSDIYGGINGFWDYGPLGAELKRNLRELWWREMTREREDVVGLDATIIMHSRVWEASGHLTTFADPMVDCRQCKGRFRADQLPRKKEESFCPTCGARDFTEARMFNLMFKTNTGPVESDENTVYLRPETAQAIFAQFKNVLDTSRQKVPFGVCQIGKAFRNEINPRNYTFRSREFEQMELEFFIRPDEAIELIHGSAESWVEGADLSSPQPAWGWEMWHRYWVDQRTKFYHKIGLGTDVLAYHWQKKEELAHYARATVDILFKFPFGTEELEGIAARGDFDLTQHQKFSGKPLEFFDEELKAAAGKCDAAAKTAFGAKVAAEWVDRAVQAAQEKRGDEAEAADKARLAAEAFCERLFKGFYLPHVIEPSAGLDRLALAILCQAFNEEENIDEKGKKEVRTVMRFPPSVAPVKVGVFPLLKNKPELVAKARQVYALLKSEMTCFYDEGGSIGRRYARQDEAGTPFCLTIDFETLGEKGPELQDTVTVRERDTAAQERVKIAQLRASLQARM
ncbi:MAG: glycine--tRNA ligase [Verrucomicrobiales bacterium]